MLNNNHNIMAETKLPAIPDDQTGKTPKREREQYYECSVTQ